MAYQSALETFAHALESLMFHASLRESHAVIRERCAGSKKIHQSLVSGRASVALDRSLKCGDLSVGDLSRLLPVFCVNTERLWARSYDNAFSCATRKTGPWI